MRQGLVQKLLLLMLAVFSTVASAEVFVGEEIEVELVSESANVVPGETLWTAVRLKPTEGWHTYSKWPGDSGDATMIHEWQLPEGATAGDIHWPVPSWLPFPGTDLVTFSYKEEVLLMVPIQVPADLSGEQFNATAHVEWQGCDLICLIGDAEISLTLPVDRDGELQPDPRWADAFAETRELLPVEDHKLDSMFAIAGDRVSFSVSSNEREFDDVEEAWFFPEQRRILSPGPLRDVTVYPGLVQITHGQPRRMLTDLTEIAGMLAVQRSNGDIDGFVVNATESTPEGLAALATVAAEQSMNNSGPGAAAGDQNLLLILAFALAGGVILNLMPCVFPVLSLKVVNLTSKAGASSGTHRMHGVVYAAGIIVSFMILATILLALRAGGQAVGWAFQLQSPWFVGALALLFFVIGLNLSGVFEFGTRLMGLGSNLGTGNGYRSSFLTGVLATVVASPCTAPFMGAALGFALSQSWIVAMLVFGFLGLGMALPFLILTFVPGLMKRMPKPGPWMETFKQFMAFPMYAAALWLLWVLGLQVGVDGMTAVASAGLMVALAVWLLQKSAGHSGAKTLVGRVAGVVLIIGGLSFLWTPMLVPGNGAGGDTGIDMTGEDYMAEFEPFASARIDELRAQGKPVLLNMTAAWCITCLANERTTLSTQRVQQALVDNGVTYMKGDWTNQDPEITKVLDAFNRPSVPLYILYPGDPALEPVILPQLLTPSIVIDAVASL
ncbi:MAG TPA: thiol:disulfide interchange protein [Pseudohongiella sp.]|nr:thiol:disulfide interchange protein [Pseudohongiella sp.]